eukprot:s726_g17.t1
MRKKLQTSDKLRIASVNALQKMSASLTTGLNVGFEEFMPSVRFIPGQPLPSCRPSDFQQSTLVIVSDEGPDMKLSSSFLSSVGLRVRWEKDFSHRYDNTHKCALSDAQYDDVLAKISFVSRINRGPWGSGKNQHVKAELFTQMAQVFKVSDARLKQAEADVLFDRHSSAFWSDAVADEMLGDVPTIFSQTEGMEGKRFFSFVKEWRNVDQAWTMEFLSLDLFFKGEGKVNPHVSASHLVHAWWWVGIICEGNESLSSLRKKNPKTLPLAWTVLSDRSVPCLAIRTWHVATVTLAAVYFDSGLLEDFVALNNANNLMLLVLSAVRCRQTVSQSVVSGAACPVVALRFRFLFWVTAGWLAAQLADGRHLPHLT